MARIAVRMPKMSMTMTEGEVSEWFVKPGDAISEGDVICEVLTDKVDMEVESPASGVLASIDVESGTVDVGTPIGWIEGDDSSGFGDLLAGIGGDPATEAEADATESGTTGPDTADSGAVPATVNQIDDSTRPTGPIAAVPRARGLARERGIDLDALTGSGPDGLVTVTDVQARLGIEATAPPAREPSPRARATVSGTATSATADVPTAATDRAARRAAQVRARVAAKMVESASVPQFTLWRDLQLDAANPRRAGISWTTVLLSSYASALREVPELLTRWEDDRAVPTSAPSIGIAVATPHGLFAPVITEPDVTDPRALDAQVKGIVKVAQTGKVDAAYLQNANGMLSNLGSAGIDRFNALLTPPQASVLSVGSIRPRPVAVPGGLGVALTVTVGLTIDHRVADGAHGAALLESFTQKVTEWGLTAGRSNNTET